MKIRTSELIGPALDWAVAKCEKHSTTSCPPDAFIELHLIGRNNYSSNWAIAGPIIERMRGLKLKIGRKPGAPCYAHVVTYNGVERWHQTGKTLLIAAMRCYCCAKLGDEIDIPQELLPCQQPNP